MLVFFIDPSSISLGGRDISCLRDEMQLTLSRLTYPWLHPKYFDMHLLDNSCGLFHVNFTHIIVKTTYGECKTARRNTADGVIIYGNILIALVKFQPGQVITRVPDVFFPFQCRFDPTKKVTSISSKTSSPKGNGELSSLFCRSSLSVLNLVQELFPTTLFTDSLKLCTKKPIVPIS